MLEKKKLLGDEGQGKFVLKCPKGACRPSWIFVSFTFLDDCCNEDDIAINSKRGEGGREREMVLAAVF